MEFRKLAIALAATAGLTASAAMAATDGTLGTTSTGNFDINYIKGDQARVWGLADLNMTDTHTSGDELTQDICIFSNKASSSNVYELTLSSANSFTLIDGTGGGAAAIGYNIKVEGIGTGTGTLDSSDISGGNYVDNGMNAGPLANQPDPSQNCTANQNAQVSVWFDSAPNITTGAYYDTVTLLVTPQ